MEFLKLGQSVSPSVCNPPPPPPAPPLPAQSWCWHLSLCECQHLSLHQILLNLSGFIFLKTGVWWWWWWQYLASSLLLRLGSWGEDWQEHFIRQRKQFYEGPGRPGSCWQPDILMSRISHSPTQENRRTPRQHFDSQAVPLSRRYKSQGWI